MDRVRTEQFMDIIEGGGILWLHLTQKTPLYTHKRNEEGDQGGPWTPLEGPKIYFRRS